MEINEIKNNQVQLFINTNNNPNSDSANRIAISFDKKFLSKNFLMTNRPSSTEEPSLNVNSEVTHKKNEKKDSQEIQDDCVIIEESKSMTIIGKRLYQGELQYLISRPGSSSK